MGLHIFIHVNIPQVCPKRQYSDIQKDTPVYFIEKRSNANINFIIIIIQVMYAFQFVIVGTFGETPQTDIAVDAVCVTTCGGEKMSDYMWVSNPLFN